MYSDVRILVWGGKRERGIAAGISLAHTTARVERARNWRWKLNTQKVAHTTGRVERARNWRWKLNTQKVEFCIFRCQSI